MSRQIDPNTPIDELSPEDRAYLAERDRMSAQFGMPMIAPVSGSGVSADLMRLDAFLRVEYADEFQPGESAVDLAIRLLSEPAGDDYDNMKAAELHELAKSRDGLELPAKITKPALIEALRVWDAATDE